MVKNDKHGQKWSKIAKIAKNYKNGKKIDTNYKNAQKMSKCSKIVKHGKKWQTLENGRFSFQFHNNNNKNCTRNNGTKPIILCQFKCHKHI